VGNGCVAHTLVQFAPVRRRVLPLPRDRIGEGRALGSPDRAVERLGPGQQHGLGPQSIKVLGDRALRDRQPFCHAQHARRRGVSGERLARADVRDGPHRSARDAAVRQREAVVAQAARLPRQAA
jgi:hypothetical protein